MAEIAREVVTIERIEVLTNGASATYGSQAVAGVANIITRRHVDRTELQAVVEVPFESGGERYRVGGITGWNFAKGAAASRYR